MCSDPDGLDDRPHLVRARQHDDVQAAVDLHQFLQRFQSIHLRHQYIQDNEVGPLAFVHFFERFFPGADGFHLESVDFQQRLQVLSNAGLVVHNKNFFFHSHRFSLSIRKTFRALALIHWQQKRKLTSRLRLARYPDLSAMCLNEPFRDRQPQTHSRRISVHAYKIFKYLLMMLGRDTRPRIRYAYFHTVRARQPEPAPFFHWSQRRHAPFPEMWCRPQRYAATARRMLQGVIKEIRSRLLHLLIIESECRNGRVKARVQLDPFTLKRLRPALGEFIQTISQIVLSELQHQFSALQGRVVQEHRHQTH